jgi:AcrR family transcriptional regulator
MPATSRRQPRQARALATRAAIFEATARILEAQGEAALNTNRIAERAGVSVGTLYQYFADKQAILVAMAMAENAKVRAVLAQEGGDLSPHRRAIRAQITALKDFPATRRAALKAIQAAEGGAVVVRETLVADPLLPRPVDADDLDLFVISRAITGVVRAAVSEASPYLTDPRLEDALVRLAKCYRGS